MYGHDSHGDTFEILDTADYQHSYLSYSAHIEIVLLESLTLHNLRELLDSDRRHAMQSIDGCRRNRTFHRRSITSAVYLPDEKKIPSETPRRRVKDFVGALCETIAG